MPGLAELLLTEMDPPRPYFCFGRVASLKVYPLKAAYMIICFQEEKKLVSIPFPGASGDTTTKQMTLGDHINSIILLDYERKESKQGPPQPSLLSQINGSVQTGKG